MAGLVLAGVAGVAACGDEDPVSVGSDLLGEGFRTYAVVLDSEAFLQSDTTYDRMGSLNNAFFWIVANDFGGELDARTLVRVALPDDAVYEDSAGTVIRDSIASIQGATIRVVVDSLSDPVDPFTLEVLAMAESWDHGTVSWDLRYDTAGVAEPWTQPGGTTAGEVLGSGTWDPESGDTVVIAIDSADATVWQDSAGAHHGAMVRVATPDTRVRIQSLSFAFDVVPADAPEQEARSGGVLATVSVANPDTTAVTADELRVGGLPVWRSILEFRPMDDLTIPCGDGLPDCTVPLSRATVNLATLILEPLPVAGRRIERPVRLESRAVLRAPEVPLTRSPLSPTLGLMDDSLTAAAFLGSPDPGVARIPLTEFVRRAVNPTEARPALTWLALTAFGERSMFGYTRFGSVDSASPPRLELVVTVPVQELSQ
jgi:hypothetical protein